MEGLTKGQLQFLESQGITLDLVFNAKGYSASEYKVLMKEQGKIVAFNVTPCAKAGHSLKTRHGHCVQCDTSKFSFVSHSIKPGVVYIAGSVKGQVIKVGYTKSKEIREESLVRSKYGGYEDWKVLFSASSTDASRIEKLTQSSLRRYGFSNGYDHDGHIQDSYEMFKCSYSKAKETMDGLISTNEIPVSGIYENKTKLSSYTFRNLAKQAE